MARQRRQSQHGFTLIEVVVAMGIFAVLSVTAFLSFNQILNSENRSRAIMEEQAHMHRAWNIVLQDLLHIRPRTLRDQLDGNIRAYAAGAGSEYLVQFVRGGMPMFASTPAGLQRVAYDIEDGVLMRLSWPTLDALTDAKPLKTPILDSVKQVKLEQLAPNNQYVEEWPPLNQTVAAQELPRMIRVEIELLDGQVFSRLVPGVATPKISPQGQNNGDEGDDN